MLCRLFTIAILIFMLCFSGCGTVQQPTRKPAPQTGQVIGKAYLNSEITTAAQDMARTIPNVENSIALALNDHLAVAVQVKGFERLHLQTIRQELHSRIKNIVPDYDIHVTTDKKLFAQLQLLIKQIQESPEENLTEDLVKNYNIIIRDMNG